jgi:hypothetical protein
VRRRAGVQPSARDQCAVETPLCRNCRCTCSVKHPREHEVSRPELPKSLPMSEPCQALKLLQQSATQQRVGGETQNHRGRLSSEGQKAFVSPPPANGLACSRARLVARRLHAGVGRSCSTHLDSSVFIRYPSRQSTEPTRRSPPWLQPLSSILAEGVSRLGASLSTFFRWER